jgi:hypothetical protein
MDFTISAGRGEILHRERTIETDFDDAGFFAVVIEPADGFADGFGSGAHDDDHALGFGCAS